MSNDSSNTENLSILLVENSRTARAVMNAILTKAGYQVTSAATGPQALELLEDHQFHLIIMDVFMPLMNGYEVSEKIRSSDKHYANIPIVAYSGSQNPRDAILCKESGINAFLTKEEDNKSLVNWIKNFSESNPNTF